MNISPFHVWAIVRHLPAMQNLIVNRFRRRSDAEECLRLLRRSMPSANYIIVYSPPDQNKGVVMPSVPQDWAMYEPDGDVAVAEMMQEVRDALNHQPLPKVRNFLKAKIEAVSQTHPEIYDSEVRNIIVGRLTDWACQVHELSPQFGLPVDYWGL